MQAEALICLRHNQEPNTVAIAFANAVTAPADSQYTIARRGALSIFQVFSRVFPEVIHRQRQ